MRAFDPREGRVRLSDGEIEANAQLVARAVLHHPLAASLSGTTRAVALAIARRHHLCMTPGERRSLRAALTALDDAVIAASRERSL